jgi:hypothetical protein
VDVGVSQHEVGFILVEVTASSSAGPPPALALPQASLHVAVPYLGCPNWTRGRK